MNSLIKPEYETLIFHFRGFKVMIDADLAILYGVSTKALKQQVKRNIERFPEDFMFELTKNEKDELVTNCDRLALLKHSSVNPLAFTEQGVSMLSSVLRSEKAIQINIEIMRAFARYRALLRENKELKMEILKLDAKLNKAFKFLLDKLDALHQKTDTPRKPIGYKTDKNE
ncbi:MAG TPA: ORF6N domain-containing protein [Bacteroidales bacterium]|nr:ORF6N domain-containing protein [Bacteroidales bacterium]